jgi:LysM repeat protein
VTATDVNDYLTGLPYSRKSHTAEAGETVRSIADDLGISSDELMSFNDLASSGDVEEGTTVVYWELAPSP